MKQAGRRDRYIQVMRRDDYGSNSGESWTEHKALWAELVPRGSRAAIETVAAYQMFPQSRTIFVVDHPDPAGAGSSEMILHSDRIHWDGRQFSIQGFEEIGRRDGLRIYCTEIGDGVEG